MEREKLEVLVRRGYSSRRIAAALGVSQGTVNYWLKLHGLRTERARASHGDGNPRATSQVTRTCIHHGATVYIRYGEADHYRCLLCRRERVIARRRRVKEILVAEAGGACLLCGYARHAGALHFHHLDPATKEFALALNGVARSLARSRAEAAKCVLLCANCHAEVEAGVTGLPLTASQGDPAQLSRSDPG